MKVEKLIFGAVLIVCGVFAYIGWWSLGSMGSIIAIIGAIPMIISGVLLMLIGLIQGKVDGMGRNEKLLLVLFILASAPAFMGSIHFNFIGISLIVIGIILALPSKRRMLQLILSAIVLVIMITTELLISIIFAPVPVPLP